MRRVGFGSEQTVRAIYRSAVQRSAAGNQLSHYASRYLLGYNMDGEKLPSSLLAAVYYSYFS